MRNASGEWQDDVTQLTHTVGTMAALWLFTGGPLKFANILYKAAN